MPTISTLLSTPDGEASADFAANDEDIICGPNFLLFVVAAEVGASYSLQVTFNDGTHKLVNVRPLLWGPVFKPLLDPDYFDRMRLSTSGVVVWPNGANLAPEALYELPNEGAIELNHHSYAYA